MARATDTLTALLLAGVLSTPAHGASLSLAEVVARLAEQGQDIVYSSDLIEADTTVDLPRLDLTALSDWLLERQLTLEAVGDGWVITRSRSTPAPPSPPAAAEPAPIVEHVIVTGTRRRLDGVTRSGTVTSLTADDLFSVPALGGDAVRVVTSLPGMATMGVSAKPYIRGGLQDELLVRLDGVELLDAYHLADFQNIFSVIDDRSVSSVDVYSGGFPARYGDRMGGVMDVTSRQTEVPARTELGLSIFSLFGNTQGTVNDGDTGYLLSARRGNLDVVLDQVDPGVGRPRYHDAYLRIDQRLGAFHRLSGAAFLSKDDVELHEDETRASSNIDNRYLWLRLRQDADPALRAEHALAYSWSRRRKQQQDLDDSSGAGGFLDQEVDLWKLRASSDFSWSRSEWLMEFGGLVEYATARYRSAALVDRGLLGELLSGAALDGHDIDTDPAGWSGGVYWAGEVPLGASLTLTPGLRWDTDELAPGGRQSHFSPRLGLRYRPDARLTFHVDAGRFYQTEEIHELPAADGVAAFSPPQSSDHFIAGVDWFPMIGWDARLEVYDKRYRDTKVRFENLYNPFVLVPELEPDRVELQPDRARARGADVTVRHRLSAAAALTLQYSYMDAEDRLDGDWVPRRWSQRHSASALAQWQGPRLTASVALSWHSGWRGAAVPATLDAGETLNLADVLNAAQLDDYLSLDVSVRRLWERRRYTITAFASVTNLTDRDNVAGIEYDPVMEDDVVEFERSEEFLLPRVPSIGVMIAF